MGGVAQADTTTRIRDLCAEYGWGAEDWRSLLYGLGLATLEEVTAVKAAGHGYVWPEVWGELVDYLRTEEGRCEAEERLGIMGR